MVTEEVEEEGWVGVGIREGGEVDDFLVPFLGVGVGCVVGGEPLDESCHGLGI